MWKLSEMQNAPTLQNNDLPDLKLRASRGGFTLLVASQAVPIIVLINLRYVMAASYVSSHVDQLTGALISLVMIASGLVAWLALMNVKQRNRSQLNRYFWITMVLGAIAAVMALYQLWFHGVNSVGHYGETYLTITGVLAGYMVIGLVALYSGKSRNWRVGLNDDNEFSVGSTFKYWIFIVLAWLIMYLDLYLF